MCLNKLHEHFFINDYHIIVAAVPIDSSTPPSPCNVWVFADYDMCFPQSYCEDPDLVLELKNLIVIFADTLQVGSELYFIWTACDSEVCRTMDINTLNFLYVWTGLWFSSEPAVWPVVWGQRPVQRNSAEEVGTGFQVGFNFMIRKNIFRVFFRRFSVRTDWCKVVVSGITSPAWSVHGEEKSTLLVLRTT